MHGVINTGIVGRGADYLFRVSLKAVIFNPEGKLLDTNEASRSWHLPGGGMEHGETIEQGIKRELREELGYEGNITYEVIGAEPMWMGDELAMWQMWIVSRVELDSFDFMDERCHLVALDELKAMEKFDSQLSYKFAVSGLQKTGVY